VLSTSPPASFTPIDAYHATLPNASYSCPLSLATAAIINQFHVTGQGIEGRWHANDGGNCTESGHFSAVDLSLR